VVNSAGQIYFQASACQQEQVIAFQNIKREELEIADNELQKQL